MNELIVAEQINPMELFTQNGADALLDNIKAKAGSVDMQDVATSKGRAAIVSNAAKIASSKVLIDKMGKELVADWKAKSKKVDITRKYLRDALEYFQAETRLPVTTWESERAKQEQLRQYLEMLERDWKDALAEDELFNRQRAIELREAELARQEKKRRGKQEAEQKAQEQADREEMIRKESIEQAIREAAKKQEEETRAAFWREVEAKNEAKRQAEEHQRALEKAEADRLEAIEQERERARLEAERKEQDRIAVERWEQEKKERERKERERKAADEQHRKSINDDVISHLVFNGVSQTTAQLLVDLISAGSISHVQINY